MNRILWSCIFLLFSCKNPSSISFVCPPCDQVCDEITFKNAGVCNSCKMTLIKKRELSDSFSRKRAIMDIKTLAQILKTNHPCLYQYIDEVKFDEIVEYSFRRCDSISTVIEFYKIVSHLIASIGDAHTSVINPYENVILNDKLLFPIQIRVDSNLLLSEGKDIIAINGYSSVQILETIQSYVEGNGSNYSYRNSIIESKFPLLFYLFVDNASTFTILYSNNISQELLGRKYKTVEIYKEYNSPRFELRDDTAILKIESWEDPSASSFNHNLSYEAFNSTLGQFIYNAMTEVIASDSITYLKIDLRGNKGGKSGPAALLLSYLIDQPFNYYSKIYIESKKNPFIKNVSIQSGMDFESITRLFEDKNDSINKFPIRKEINSKVYPQPKTYKHEIEIVLDKYSLSVSMDVAAILKLNRKVKISADETGGSYDRYCAGNYLKLILPESEIQVNLPIQQLVY